MKNLDVEKESEERGVDGKARMREKEIRNRKELNSTTAKMHSQKTKRSSGDEIG